MKTQAEVLFVDPGVADLPFVLEGLRPGVEAVAPAPDAPAARQIAAAFDGGADLGVRAARPAPQPPLTAAGLEAFAGVLAAGRILVSGPIPDGETTEQVSYCVIDAASQAVLGRFVLPNESHTMRAFRLLVDVSALVDAYDVGVFGADGRFTSSNFTVEAPPSGAVGAAA